MKMNRMAFRMWMGALVLAFGLPAAALADWGDTDYWKAGSANGNWDNDFWYNTTRSWDNHNPGYVGGQDLRFDNDSNLTMDNNWSGQGTNMWRITFESGTGARTIGGTTENTFRNNGTPKIENNDADTQTINFPFRLETGMEINPVSGDLTINSAIANNGQWINVYGNNQKTLSLNGVLSGSGGLAVKQDSIVELTNNNTFSSSIWVEKGTVKVGTHTNAIGSSGTVNVGTNATLELTYGGTTVRPATLNLYGTGTNSSMGALRKTTSSSTTWRGGINLGQDSKIVVTGGGISIYDDITLNAHTLYVTNTVTVQQTGGDISGTKTTGDGAIHKTGSSTLTLRPGSGLTGSILLHQGAIRQNVGNSSVVPAGGLLVMSNGTTYRTATTTARTMAKNSQIRGDVDLNYSSSGGLTFSGNMDLYGGHRTLTIDGATTVSGVITNGSLAKAGSYQLTLTGNNTYADGTTISAGTLQVGSSGTSGSLTGAITNNSAIVFDRSDALTHSGAISGTGTLTKNGAGALTLSGVNTYSGNSTVSVGSVLVSGSADSSAFTVASGATLGGAGSVGSIAANGLVSPGNSASAVGTLDCTALTLGDGGGYTFDISNVSGTAGTQWDLIDGSGVLTVNGSGTFTIYLNGNPTGFDSATGYQWTMMNGSSLSGFDSARFAVNTDDFTPSLNGGTFSVSDSGNNIQLVFTPGAPSAPTGLSASDGTSTAHAALSWTDVSGETGYVIWRYTTDTPASALAIYTNAADAITYNDTSAVPGQLYYYWVSATNAAGSSAKSTSDSGYRKLATVGSLSATDGTDLTKVVLTWADGTGETGYGIWRHTSDASGSATWLANAAAEATGYDDSSATAGQQYYYWVRATNSTSASQSDFQGSGEGGYVKLPTVADVAATDALTDKITVSWTDSDDGETGYTVWRYTADTSGSATLISGAPLAASATSYDDTTAVAGTPYWYWVRATNSTSVSMSDFSASDEGLRTLTEPTLAASNIVFSSLATTSYTVGWERGDGDYVLVVAKQGGAPTDPSDSTAYSADAAFGSGDTTAAGSYVVYKGTGTSVPVTALIAGTEYHFAVYEFNGVTTPNYRTSDAPTDSQHTLVAEPTTQATSILVGTVNEVSLANISWTDGNGAGRLVVVKAGGAVDSFPLDGSNYTANATFGSGTEIGTGNYVVHDGASPLATLSGLTRDVIYHFRVFEYNGTLGTTVNFFTNSATGNPISQTTRAVTPGSNPTGLDITAIGTTGFTISWTKGTTGTNTLIVVRAGAGPADPSDLNSYTADSAFGGGSDLGSSSYVVYNGTGAGVDVTGLTPGTRYYVEASSFNGSSGSENYRGTPTADNDYTLMGEPSQSTSIAFGTLDSTSYAVSYTAGDGLSRLVIAHAGGAVDWFPTDGTAYTGENGDIGSAQEYGTGNFLVHRGTSPFTLSGLTAATDYYIRIYEYQGTNATLNYNTNAASGNPANRYSLSTEPSAHAATFTATAVSDTEIDLVWGAATGESGFIIVRKVGSAPTGTPADGTQYAQGNAIGDGTVVYVTTSSGASSTTDSYSTAADTAYYYQIFPYSYDGTPADATYNYRTAATVPSDNATTGSSEPANSSSVVSFLPASSTSATITWTNTGSADGSILVVHAGAAVDSHPVDWSGYTANTVFQSGDEIGSGNFVVFAGAGTYGDVTVTGLGAGTNYNVAVYPYNGSGTFLNYKTSSPGTDTLSILPAPTAQSATADGKTLIDLAWTKNASYDVMIVHRDGSASTEPTQGTPYSVGGACGSGTVIYKGSAAALEHVVASGTTHYYAFYSYSGNYYSAGVTASESTTAFASGEIVETFSYTNSTALTGLDGDNGWGGAWYGDTGVYTNSSGSFTTQTNYPATSGNKLWVYPPDNTGKSVYRPLAQEYKSGKIYFGYILNYTWSGANKYAGLSLYWTNSSEKLFIGEIYGQDQQLGIDSTGSSYTLTAGSGNDYIIVGYYDWAAGEAKANAYKIGTAAVPTDEPSSWDVTVSKASNTVGTVNTIRLAAGAGASDGTPGNTYFDEVRISTNWSDLIGVVPSKPADPSSQTATVDGKEMVRLAWNTNAAGSSVMILHKATAISTDPTDGVGYSAGDTLDGATVIYKGAAKALEHVVTPGTTNNYKFYSYSGSDYYSTGVVASVTNEAYASYVNVNPFSYTNATTLGSSTIGGQGFGGNFWVADSGTWTAQTNYTTAVTDDTPVFFNMSNYPTMQGNLVVASDPGNGSSALAQRSLDSAISTGTFYVAFMMSYQHYGSNKWAGLSLFNGGTEKAFFGKGGGGNWSTLGLSDGTTTFWSAYDMGQFNSGNGDTGNVYLVVGKYDFSSKELAAKAYRILDGYTFPDSEPTWDVTTTLGTGIDSIDRIKLNAGSSDAGNTIGKVFYDEIRYATNWSDLLTLTCPTWAGSNTLGNTTTWLGDSEDFEFQSYPVGLGQSGYTVFDWDQSSAFATSNTMAWWQNANNNTYWTNRIQMTTAGVITSRFTAAGSSCSDISTNNEPITVQNLNAPSNAVATRDAVNTNSQINLVWDRGLSGVEKDTIILRRTGFAPDQDPVDGVTYNVNDVIGSSVVIYRGSGSSFSDTGLSPSTTYYYWFYAENYTYYSASHDTENENTLAGGKDIVIDGDPADWVGTPSTVLDSSATSVEELIWTDKEGESRTDQTAYSNGDFTEFRTYADADWVYFLIEMENISNVTNVFVAIGVDTRTNSSSTAMNWLGDDSETFIGDGYFDGSATHYPEYQLNVHYVTADGGTRIEMYVHNGTDWYAPGTGGNTNVAVSTVNNVIELKVARADLNLTGTKTARMTIASYLSTGAWNNDGDGTVLFAENTADAMDSLSIPPWGESDNQADMSAWLEDISDADIDCWLDMEVDASGLIENAAASTPVLASPTNNAVITASPNLIWNDSSDSDGEVTGYLLEVSTNNQFNGVTGTENGSVQLRVHLAAGTTNYNLTTTATQYWWRVRSRDNAGELSSATTHTFQVVGKLDTEGPIPTLLYIGTNVAGYLAGDYDAQIAQYGPIQSVLDREIQDTNNVFGFVLQWEDASGVYATNHQRSTDSPPSAGGFAFNIVSSDGRVSPNWDLFETNTSTGVTRDWALDAPFYATNTYAVGNDDLDITNWVHAAFSMTNYDNAIEYYLTISAEDAYADGGSWWSSGSWNSFGAAASLPYYSGWCEDGPNTARNITTNQLIRINVTDDDIIAPVPSKALAWAHDASMVVSNSGGSFSYVSGTGQEVLYEVMDGLLIGDFLSISFNAYDSYYKGVALGTTETYSESGRTLTNSAFVAAYWETNWANYNSTLSVTTDTTDANTKLNWYWASMTTQDVTSLWGPTSLDGELGVTNLIQVDLFDVDNNREGDQANDRENFGRIQLRDDDATNPVVDTASLTVKGTGLAQEYKLTNLVEWTFTGSGSERLVSTNAIVPAEISSGDFTNDTGAIQGTDVITVSAGFATAATRAWILSLSTVSTVDTFKAISISYESKVSSLNGPDRILIYGTMPEGSETLWASNDIDLSDPDNPVGTNWNSYSTALAMPSASTGSVTFKLEAYVADTNHLTGTGTATWSVDNLILSGYILGAAGGTEITDHDLASGLVQFEMDASDIYSGIDGSIGVSTGRAPRVDFWNVSSNVVPMTNSFITNGWSAATNTTLTLSGEGAAADKKQIALGAGGNSLTYYARFTATDADRDRNGDWRSVSYQTTNTVYDEDNKAPARGYKFGGPLGVYVDGSLTKAVSSGTTREYRINDEQLQSVGAGAITVKINLYDYSGWTIPTLSYSNSVAGLIATNTWLTSLHTDDVNTTNDPDAEMEWTLSSSQAQSFFTDYESVTNQFRVVSSWDKDDDRQDAIGDNVDALELAQSRLGYLMFIDNDVGQPNLQSSWSVSRTNWNVPKIYIGLPGDSGSSNILINGDIVLADTNSSAVLSDMTNRVYDSQLAESSASSPLSVVLPGYDTGGGGSGRTIKGLFRGTNSTESSTNGGAHTYTNTILNIGTVVVDNASAYNETYSSPQSHTKIAAQFPTSTWAFTSFSYTEVGAWLPAGAVSSNQVLSVSLFDADDNRPNDQRTRDVPFGILMTLDNDTVAPTTPTNVKVNGAAFTGGMTRANAAWTNQPEFRVSFEPSVDGEPTGTDLNKSGLGEHRVAAIKTDIGPDLGTPIAVAANNSLANYGFESGSTNWTLSGAVVTNTEAYEGQYSLKMLGSTAHQTVQLFNTNGYAPRVAVNGAQYHGTGTVNVTVTGLDSSGTPVGGASFDVPIVGVAGQWEGATPTSNTLATTVDQIQVTLTSTTNTYWDDIQIQIELLNGGVPEPNVNSIYTATEQGLVTNYLFAVDRDNNRAGDRKASSAPADAWIPVFGTAYDITPPTPVPLPAAAATTATVDDPTTQFDIDWSTTGVGPDDEASTNYPGGYSGTDVLAPWQTYKVYYGTFDPLDVPGGDPGHGSGSAYIYTNFISTGTYTNWSYVTSTNDITDPSASGTNYLALTNLTQSSIRLYDLEFDEDYAVIVVGIDKAGNEGTANPSSWATNNTIKFAVTQGLMRARSIVEDAFPTNNNMRAGDKETAALYWIAAGPTNEQGGYTSVSREYDLIYWDAASWDETSNSTWEKVGTVQTNWFTDAVGQDYGRGTLRHYRASYKDRWQRTNVVTGLDQRPLASEDVYAMHNVILSEGFNFVGLHGMPFTNTFAAVFGTDTNTWPSGASPAAGATRIEFFSAGESAPVDDSYFFGTDGNWYDGGTPVTTNLQSSNFFMRGFSITLPSPLPASFVTTNAWDKNAETNISAMVWHPVLKVPTNSPNGGTSFSQVISTGESGRPDTLVYNIVALNLPVSVHPSQMQLTESGFVNGAAGVSDELYTFDTSQKATRDGGTIYCDEAGTWRFVTTEGLVPAGYFKPNDVIIIVSRNGGVGNTWTWTYSPTNFYTLPTRWMGE